MTDYLELLLTSPEALFQALREQERTFLQNTAQIRADGLAEETPWLQSTAKNPDGKSTAAELTSADEEERTFPESELREETSRLPLLTAIEQTRWQQAQTAGAATRTAAGAGTGRSGGEETSPLPFGPTPRQMDLAFQRDSRRYDNGFTLF